MDPALVVPIWVAGFSTLGIFIGAAAGIITLILQQRFASAQRTVIIGQNNIADAKLDKIHDLTNSSLTAVNAKLDTANARLEERAAAEAARLAAVASAAAAPQRPSGSEASAAIAVADAAVSKKDEIVDRQK